MSKFKRINLSPHYNASIKSEGEGLSGRSWHEALAKRWHEMPSGNETLKGIPFMLGSARPEEKNLVVLAQGQTISEIPVNSKTDYICFLHFCDMNPGLANPGALAGVLADYELKFSSGLAYVHPVRRFFEIHNFFGGAVIQCFNALNSKEAKLFDPNQFVPAYDWGEAQKGFLWSKLWFHPVIFAMKNPRPGEKISSIVLRARETEKLAVMGVTLYSGPGHPLRPLKRKTYELILPAREKAKPGEIKITMDMGQITRVWATPYIPGKKWLKAEDKGLGIVRCDEQPVRNLLFDATGAEGAEITVQTPGNKKHIFSYEELFNKGKAFSRDKKARAKLLHKESAWVYVTVRDSETGRPVPTRVHFCGPRGNYIPPYGHQNEINEYFGQNYTNDLLLGRMNYAYVPGRFQMELPVGEVYIEINKGFEYEPVRKRLLVRPGQRELDLEIKKFTDWRKNNWVTSDTHHHCLNTQTGWLEGNAEGVNLLTPQAAQIARDFIGVPEITGEQSGCSDKDTIIWFGTENRHHIRGHISFIGMKGEPAFPMSDGGIDEAWFGDPDVSTLTEWADTCKKQGGLVVRCHFPGPQCEEPVYFALRKIDAAEIRGFANPQNGNLDAYCSKELYRYFNCGYRVAILGGTDKMAANMPVGGVRGYTKLLPGKKFTFDNWMEAVKKGRTFTSSGVLMGLRVNGKEMGEEIKFNKRGGTIRIEASAESIWPVHRLEIIVNGQVVAHTASESGNRKLKLRKKLRVKKSSWIAARAGSNLIAYHCWSINVSGHTSPVYVVVNNEKQFNPADARYMLTMIEGGITYLDTLAIRYSEETRKKMISVYERARRKIQRDLKEYISER